MSTHQSTHHTPRRATWFVVALSTTVAIGTAILILIGTSTDTRALIGPGRTTSPTSTHTAATTHATPVAAGTRPLSRYFRDPATHSLLHIRTTASEPAPVPDEHNQRRILPGWTTEGL